jgi:Flp pilus assembly protein TadG
MVEFAVALPVFLLVLLALIDFARLLFTYVGLADAAREMARAASISRGSNQTAINAFNNYWIVAGSVNPSTDQVKVTVADQSCVTDLRQGNTCSPDAVASVTCSLPLQSTCAIPARVSAGGGYVQVDVTYSFTFNPLFQTGFSGVSFIRPLSVLTTSERAYLE